MIKRFYRTLKNISSIKAADRPTYQIDIGNGQTIRQSGPLVAHKRLNLAKVSRFERVEQATNLPVSPSTDEVASSKTSIEGFDT